MKNVYLVTIDIHKNESGLVSYNFDIDLKIKSKRKFTVKEIKDDLIITFEGAKIPYCNLNKVAPVRDGHYEVLTFDKKLNDSIKRYLRLLVSNLV